MQLNPGQTVSPQNALHAFASFLMYEIYSVAFRVNVLMQDLTPRLPGYCFIGHEGYGFLESAGCLARVAPSL